eukprot:TRINITY_DN719_c0_g1_i1.p1 TRINITY_DN719_c0_g1~~TRINITY_DN719_c0_g1_i1.p1  ORF type:complete len:137 (+),score=4.01 TRINITY_DN719_c0_g1_i1:1568-1978(+)
MPILCLQGSWCHTAIAPLVSQAPSSPLLLHPLPTGAYAAGVDVGLPGGLTACRDASFFIFFLISAIFFRIFSWFFGSCAHSGMAPSGNTLEVPPTVRLQSEFTCPKAIREARRCSRSQKHSETANSVTMKKNTVAF